MSVEHKDITDPNLHEPKGVSTAAANRLYVANGTGSGSWKKVDSKALQGTDGDGSTANRTVLSDGADGFKLSPSPTYGNMAITNNATNMALTAVADTTFNTASQFSTITGAGAPWAGENLSNITFATDKLTIVNAGVYKIETYLNIGSFPSTTAKIAIRYKVNGTTYSTRKPTIKSSGTGAEGQLIGLGILTVAANDYVQIAVASDTTGNLLIRDANVIITPVKVV